MLFVEEARITQAKVLRPDGCNSALSTAAVQPNRTADEYRRFSVDFSKRTEKGGC